MAQVIDLTVDDLPDYEDFFWIPGYLRGERRDAEARLANASIELEDLDTEYETLMKRKKELNDAQMTLQDQIAATEFKIDSLIRTLKGIFCRLGSRYIKYQSFYEFVQRAKKP